MSPVGRREFVLTGAAFAGLAILAGCSRKDEPAAAKTGDSDALVALVYVLFPFETINRSVYRQISSRIRQSLQLRSDWDALQAEGFSALNAGNEAGWLALDEGGRIAATKAISDTPFFEAVYQVALFEFYSDPEVWAHLGYPGASAEKGGYLHRGFDDINWLPEETL